MPKIRTGALSGTLIVCSLALAPAALAVGPATVKIRVEGKSSTLLPRKIVQTRSQAVVKDSNPAHACSGTSAAGALEVGTAGSWNGTWSDSFGYSVETILGEAHPFSGPDYYALWLNKRAASTGVCQAELEPGDEVLLFVDQCTDFDPVTSSCRDTSVPLDLRVPARGRAGETVTVNVVELAASGSARPAAGATVVSEGASSVTDMAGNARVTLGTKGPITMRATKQARVPSAVETVCLSPGDDGTCGTRDRTAPFARLLGLRDGGKYRRGPRELRARVSPDPGGIGSVRFRLRRKVGKSCTYFNGRLERFARARCGRGYSFNAGNRQDTNYLLPKRLGRGTYSLDLIVTDRAGNRSVQQVTFRVGG